MKKFLKRIPLFWLLQLGGWSGYAALLIGSLLPTQNIVLVYHGVALLAEFGSSFILHRVCRRTWRAGLRFPRSILVVLLWCAGLGYVSTTLGDIALHTAVRSFEGTFVLLDLPGTVFTGGILTSWCALYFGIRYYQAMETERYRAVIAEKSAREAELRALRYQLHPHFLFNTLNAISTLVLAGESDAATSMIARLADFLRATLEGKSSYEVPLSEELFLTQQYLAIEKIRMGDNLQISINLDASISDCLVPHLILLPLVENSIRHGIVPRRGIGHLIIEAGRMNDRVVIKVSDDGLGKTLRPQDTNGNGHRIGLENVERRLKELYGPDGKLNLSWPLEGGCNVLLEMPYRSE